MAKKEYLKLVEEDKQRLVLLQSQALTLNEQQSTLGGETLTQQQLNTLLKQRDALDKNHLVQTQRVNAQMKQQKGLLQQIVEGFKASFRNLTDYSIAYEVIGLIRQTFNSVISSTKQLDQAMVNLQIASGATYDDVFEMTKGFADLGRELGRSTQDVAAAADDWLRAGYAAEEANELIRASMNLSTLGQIDSAEATSYLISVLKGWKLEASEISTVVDKLSENYNGVCIVRCIGHNSKSR